MFIARMTEASVTKTDQRNGVSIATVTNVTSTFRSTGQTSVYKARNQTVSNTSLSTIP